LSVVSEGVLKRAFLFVLLLLLELHNGTNKSAKNNAC